MTFLSAEALCFRHGDALQPGLLQRFLHLVQLERFYDGFDFFMLSLASDAGRRSWLTDSRTM